MAGRRISLWVIFSLCCSWFFFCFSMGVFGQSGKVLTDSVFDQSQNPDVYSDPIESPIEYLEGLAKYFKASEKRNRQQEKVIEELREQVKSLSEQLEQFKNQIRISREPALLNLAPPLNENTRKRENDTDDSFSPGQAEENGDSANQTSCGDAMEFSPSSSPRSNKQIIYPHGNRTSLEVLCDFQTDGGGWTLIQKRSSGPKYEFDRNWSAYVEGFGSLSGNFWLGLDNIHALTQNGDQELRIQLEDFDGNQAWAKYSRFSISPASDFYRLAIGGFDEDSTAGDSMTVANHMYGSDKHLDGMQFSTNERDKDNWSRNCAKDLGSGRNGGWWFNNCGFSWLNGLYKEKEEFNGIVWRSWKEDSKTLAKTEMKIRKRK